MDARYINLATFRRDGTEVRTPVWYVALDGTLYVFTGGDSGKVKRLRRSSRARIAPCDVRGVVRGPWRDATAQLAPEPAGAMAAMARKYGWQLRVLHFFSVMSGRSKRRAWIAIAL